MPHIGPDGGGSGWLRPEDGIPKPRYIGAHRSRRRQRVLGENLRHFVNDPEGKTNADPAGDAFPSSVWHAFGWPKTKESPRFGGGSLSKSDW
jgi:hypothetical protein